MSSYSFSNAVIGICREAKKDKSRRNSLGTLGDLEVYLREADYFGEDEIKYFIQALELLIATSRV